MTSRSAIPAFLGTASVLAAQWYWRTLHLDAEMAASGHSPELVSALANHPEQFADDFTSSALELLKALPYNIYPAADTLGISITQTWATMIGLEMVLVAAAAAYATWTFFPRSSHVSKALAAILVSSSGLLQPDLGNFGWPFYGWVYGFSLAAFLFAISDTAARRLVPASVWLVVAYTCHPINGLFTAAFMGAMVLAAFGSWQWRDFLLPILVAGAGCGTWTAIVAANGTLGGGGIDPSLFVSLTRGQSFHWYPMFLGTFWEANSTNLMPFLATLALIAFAFGGHTEADQSIHRQVASGIILMLVLTGAGILISIFVASPTLIKLALHRAGTNAVAAGSIFVVHRLYSDLTSGDRWERALSAILLVGPFQSSGGCAPIPVLLRTTYQTFSETKERGLDRATVVAQLVCLTIVGLMVTYTLFGLVTERAFHEYLGVNVVQLVAGGLALALPTAAATQYIGLAALAVVTLLGVLTASTKGPLASKPIQEKAYGYLEAQEWAKANTPVGTLFMVDPASGYGWRDKSHRPSFGTLREWLLISIMYNSRPELLREGISRSRALGLDPLPIVQDPTANRMRPILRKLNNSARDRYYRGDLRLFETLARTYGVRYFVFEKSNIKAPVPLATAFENSSYLIAKTPDAWAGSHKATPN